MKKISSMEFLKGLAEYGMRERYGELPDPLTRLRLECELEHIKAADNAGLYVMAFWIFKHIADVRYKIAVWPRGAMASSMVCYCLGITDIDPIRYGLHSARFVNREKPKFQFDIDGNNYNQFMKRADAALQANAELLDPDLGRECLLGDIQPMSNMGKSLEKPLPADLDDEIAGYALSFPQTMGLYETYLLRKNGDEWTPTGIKAVDDILAPTYGILVYQEQMFDILKTEFRITGIKANQIRLAIQRGDAQSMEQYRNELMVEAKALNVSQFDTIWEILTSNPKAFLKAHAVSRVLSRYQ